MLLLLCFDADDGREPVPWRRRPLRFASSFQTLDSDPRYRSPPASRTAPRASKSTMGPTETDALLPARRKDDAAGLSGFSVRLDAEVDEGFEELVAFPEHLGQSTFSQAVSLRALALPNPQRTSGRARWTGYLRSTPYARTITSSSLSFGQLYNAIGDLGASYAAKSLELQSDSLDLPRSHLALSQSAPVFSQPL